MTIIAAFFLASLVMTLGFFLGALMSATKVSDLEQRNAWLIATFFGGDDPEELVKEFREQIEDFDPDDL